MMRRLFSLLTAATLGAALLAAPASALPGDRTTSFSFGPKGYGRIKLGMSLKAARKAGLITKITEPPVQGACGSFTPKDTKAGAYYEKKRGLTALFADKSMRTPWGIKLGDKFNRIWQGIPAVHGREELRPAEHGSSTAHRVSRGRSRCSMHSLTIISGPGAGQGPAPARRGHNEHAGHRRHFTPFVHAGIREALSVPEVGRYVVGVKLVVQVKLLPDEATAVALRETLHACNQAADHASRRAFVTGVKSGRALQRLVYGEVKAMGLSAQPALHAVRKTAAAYATLQANLKAGNYGPEGSKRRRAVESKPVRFRKDAAQPFDDRCLSWQTDARTVSLWTICGRVRGIPFQGSPTQVKMLTEHRRGESDLVFRGGSWYLHATCEVPEPDLLGPVGFLGVDLGIVNIATTSDGTRHSGRHLNQVRHKNRRLRGRLQKKATKSAKRLLRKLSGREARFAADTNHCIAKKIVTEAQRTCRGIALEDLGGIRDRVRLRKPQRVTLHSWSFAQLGAFVSYKAALAGVPVVFVDPRHTSQGCSECGHVSRSNRPDQSTFLCTSCGFAEHADVNAGRNIAQRGAVAWQ